MPRKAFVAEIPVDLGAPVAVCGRELQVERTLAEELLYFDVQYPGAEGAWVQVDAETWKRWTTLAMKEAIRRE